MKVHLSIVKNLRAWKCIIMDAFQNAVGNAVGYMLHNSAA